MSFYIKLAQLNIKIEHIHEKLQSFCKSYICFNEEDDISIVLNQQDIERERKQADRDDYTDSYLESIALLRKIGEVFPTYNRLLCHGAAITYADQGAFLFTAPSGTGKTTHINLWRKYLKDKVDIVNGDKPFLYVEDDQVQIYGSPWAGKEGMQKNRSDVLKGICILQQGKDNSILRLLADECLDKLLRQIYLPQDPAAAGCTLELFEKLIGLVPVYMMSCDISEEAVRTSFETLTALKYEEEKRYED